MEMDAALRHLDEEVIEALFINSQFRVYVQESNEMMITVQIGAKLTKFPNGILHVRHQYTL